MSTLTPPEGPDGPEFLEHGGGSPMTPGERPARGRGRTALLASGALLATGLVGGGVWAALAFFGTGAQPDQALPAGTLAYVSIDLDPSGQQKIEALRMLRQFPALKDQIGLDTTDDLRRSIFEQVQEESGCTDLDFDADVEPWLGDRAAIAAVETGAAAPTPVVVLQVTDPARAEDGLVALRECADDEDVAGWVIEGDWAVLAETEELAQGVVDDAAEGALADDATYQRWTEQVGDAGIVNLYAAPGAGAALLRGMGELDLPAGSPAGTPADALDELGALAGSLRFQDSALELELIADGGEAATAFGLSDRGGDVVSTLPDDTAVALGIGLDEGWFSALVDRLAPVLAGAAGAGDLMTELSGQTGLDLPADAEALTGSSMALSLGGDVDPETMINSLGFEAPVAWTVQGDSAEVEGVLAKLRAEFGPATVVLGSDSADGRTVIGPDASYRGKVLEGGNLADTEAFGEVVPEADRAAAIFFVNFDAGDGWLARAAQGDQQAVDNIEPMRAFGFSTWLEGNTAHTLVRFTTD